MKAAEKPRDETGLSQGTPAASYILATESYWRPSDTERYPDRHGTTETDARYETDIKDKY